MWHHARIVILKKSMLQQLVYKKTSFYFYMLDQFSTYAVVPKIQLLLKTLLFFFKKRDRMNKIAKK